MEDQDENRIDEDVARFPCSDCGAKLEFSPGTTLLVCSFCGAENHIALDDETVDEVDFEATLVELEASAEHEERATVKCEACGAEVDRPEKLTAFPCPFCGTDIVTRDGSRKLIKPKSLLPFALDRRQAIERFRTWIGSLWFAPSELKRFARQEGRFQGIYLPYWTYDSDTSSRYTGERGEHYWVTVTSTSTNAQGQTVTRNQQVRRTRWYPARGRVEVVFDDVLVAASQSLPRNYLEALEPWDLADLVPFQESFLSGFKAETYQVDLRAGFQRAEQLMEPVIRAAICRDIGGDEQRIHSCAITHREVSFKHLLLPVWIDAYRYRGKVYRVVVNARSGEVQGERPWSFWKIFFFVATIVALIALVIILVRSS